MPLGSSASLGLATKMRGAFSSLHQLNRRRVSTGAKAAPVCSEARNGQRSVEAVMLWVGSVVEGAAPLFPER